MNIHHPTVTLSEEVARWCFEVHIKHVDQWHIAFANPTAGPWKRVMATNSEGRRGEVYRFDRQEERPDLILYSDTMQNVLIFEAKGSLSSLLRDTQLEKSARVVADLTEVLCELSDNPFWQERSGYKIVPALLWGTKTGSREEKIRELLGSFTDRLPEGPNQLDRATVGVQVSGRTGEELECEGYRLDITDSAGLSPVIESLDLDETAV